ncbi:NAD(P)H-binding protein [Rhodococcus sp. USK13]|uniref:NmrA family NAD(P)-binding protein n=1 Tax=Rhodococcus sp. USK13 TaxID=2806442 RepID=UPI001BCE45E6|nr:NAD(P)H-binding protein [Rhodococcus sp. USK13]
MIVIFGGTGQVGSATLWALNGIASQSPTTVPPVRVLSRRPEAVPRPAALGLEVIQGNFDNQKDLERSLRGGVRTVILATGDSDGQIQRETAIIDAVQETGGIRIIKISAALAGMSPPRAIGVAHAQIEEYLIRSGLPWAIVRPTFFYQSLEMFKEPISKFGRLPLPLERGRVAFVDLHDVAFAVATLAVTPAALHGRIYLLTGPESVSLFEVCERLTSCAGRRIKPLHLPLSLFRLMLVVVGKVSWRDASIAAGVVEACAEGLEDFVTGDVLEVSGREPQSFDDYTVANIANFVGKSQPD